jgi:integrase/recombinase XerD
VLRTWLAERAGHPDQPLFPARAGGRLSRDAVERRIGKHTAAAAARCPSLNAKTITAQTLRHTAAMHLLQAGTDTSVIALWLGHEQAETTQIYLHADLALKERALARTTPRRSSPAATGHPTNCSPSWKPSDYADIPSITTGATSAFSRQVGIIPRSA